MDSPPMPELIVEDRGKYLFVEFSSDPLTLDVYVRMINAAAAAIRSGAPKNVLLVRNAPVLKGDAEAALVGSVARRSFPDDVRFAIVDIFGNDRGTIHHSAEVKRAAGWYVTDFATIDEAIAWLTAE
jgi:hypothetical protein